ncbi:MAG TPA: ABC transporter permease [Actinomycetota bacterium]|jgi:ABC-2 type transport system permease protein|nr:ABC transporter permease [Actinomycetota bacterium]
MSAVQDASVLVGKPTAPGTVERVARLWQYRNLLLNLVRRDLRIRYKESFLGFLWSLLNPMMYLAIFYVVFVIILHNGLPHFPVFLLSGLLPWTLFQNTLMGATTSVVGGAPLLKRVAFPREVLPLAVIGANIFQFFLQMLVLLGFLLLFRYHFVSSYLLLVIPALIVEILVLTGLALMVSSVTVYLRDIAHFMELATLFWFWLTPVVYQPITVYDHFVNHHLPFGLYLLNPMVVIVMAYQRAFYNAVSPLTKSGPFPVLIPRLHLGWYFQQLGILALVALVLIWIGFVVFGKGEGNFAEEL